LILTKREKRNCHPRAVHTWPECEVSDNAAQSSDAWMLPIPATFIVGRNGVIPRMGIEDMLAALRAP
jgi:hypothetical protein